MSTWEYLHAVDHHSEQVGHAGGVCVWGSTKGRSVPDLFAYMEQLGKDGWELVTVIDTGGFTFYSFKRMVMRT